MSRCCQLIFALTSQAGRARSARRDLTFTPAKSWDWSERVVREKALLRWRSFGCSAMRAELQEGSCFVAETCWLCPSVRCVAFVDVRLR